MFARVLYFCSCVVVFIGERPSSCLEMKHLLSKLQLLLYAVIMIEQNERR